MSYNTWSIKILVNKVEYLLFCTVLAVKYLRCMKVNADITHFLDYYFSVILPSFKGLNRQSW